MRYLICAFISLVLFACFGARAETAKTTFIAEELKFLKGHGPIKYCIDPYWKPLEFRDKNNQHQGLSADFIKLFAKNSGIEFEFVPTKTWRESLRFLKDRHCDILTLAMPTKERMKYMAFTTPYVDFPLVIATKSDVSFISDFRKVLDKTFAVVKGYALVDEIQKKYKGVKLIEASDVTQGLEYVRLGKAFGFIDTVATIAHAVKEENLIELKIAGKLEEEWPLGVGVRNDLPTLLSIMQKNVAYISDGEKQTILNRWIAVRYEKGFDYQLFWKLLAAIVFIGLFLLFRYRELSRINAKLTRSEKRYRALFESSGDAIYLIRDGRYVDCNSAAVNLYGFSREEIIGVEPYQLSPQFQPGGRLSSDVANEKITSALSGQPQLVEWQSMREDGSLVDTEVILTAVEIGEVPHLLANVRDVTERKQSEEKIEHLAFYDQLTAIPNRSFFLGCLEQQIKECRATGHFAAILLTDVLNFNLINNSLGHRNGDELLKQIAHRLVQCEGEAGTVARLGGDVFAFLFPNIGETKLEALAGVELITVKIFRAFEETFTVGGVVQHCRAVIGATLIGTDAGTPEELLSEVELAAEVGKREKDDTVKLYDPQLQSLASRRAQIEESLRQAIGQSEFELHYQPQLSMGKLVGLEALIRWRQPENGMISPGEFIPISEETGLIIPIGDWVMREACEQIKRWEKHPVLSGVPVAVNISAAQMTLQNFVGRALNIITQTKASPRMLKFELTESALARDSDNAVEKMWALRAAGIQFSLDDFGTGYSSLGYLKRLPIDQIKIDQSFVRDLLADVDDATIAKTIINLARDFGMNVIAEGVETEAQQRFLENLGCHTYQGYLFARPMPANELEEYAAELA